MGRQTARDNAKIIIRYGGKELVINEPFTAGDSAVDIINMAVKNFRIGSVVKFDLSVSSKWNEQIRNAYSEIEVMDMQGNILGTAKSPDTDLSPNAITTISSYWDANDLQVGEYMGRSTVHYMDKTTQKSFKAIVGIDSFNIISDGMTGNLVAKDENAAKTSLTTIIIIILVLINIGWFTYYKFLRKKPGQQ